MSFVNTLTNVVTTLTNDTDLQAYALTTWGKNVTVKKGFRQRLEIGLDELPLIRVTRPEDTPDTRSGNIIIMHKVRLYAGIYQPDKDAAVDQIITFGELIRAALRKDRRRGGTAQTTIPGAIVNDEEGLADSFFLVMDTDIETNTVS
jgi:hypothetical protein